MGVLPGIESEVILNMLVYTVIQTLKRAPIRLSGGKLLSPATPPLRFYVRLQTRKLNA